MSRSNKMSINLTETEHDLLVEISKAIGFRPAALARQFIVEAIYAHEFEEVEEVGHSVLPELPDTLPDFFADIVPTNAPVKSEDTVRAGTDDISQGS